MYKIIYIIVFDEISDLLQPQCSMVFNNEVKNDLRVSIKLILSLFPLYDTCSRPHFCDTATTFFLQYDHLAFLQFLDEDFFYFPSRSLNSIIGRCNGGVYYQFVLHIASFLSGGLVQESTDEARLNQNEGIDRAETLVHHYK